MLLAELTRCQAGDESEVCARGVVRGRDSALLLFENESSALIL
jgi:hypothetical protein